MTARGSEMTPNFALEGVRYRSEAEISRYMAAGDWMGSTAGEELRAAARAESGKIAVHSHDGALTFAELDRKAESLAASLLEAGLRPRDRVLFQIGTVKELFVILYACFKVGIIPVCTLPQHRDIEIAHIARQAKAKGLFVQADAHPKFDMLQFARRMRDATNSITYLGVTRGPASADVLRLDDMADRYERESALQQTQPYQPSAADVIVFQLSGGSTGLPKVIPRMHGEYLAQANAVARRYELTGDDVCLWTLPLIHNAGMLLIVIPTIVQRRAAVIQPRFELQSFLQSISQYRVTFSGSIGPIAPRLLELRDIRRYDLQSLRQFFCMSRADAMEGHAGVKCINQYGITEGLIMASAPSDSSAARHDTNGWPTGALDEIRLLHPGSEHVAIPGESGELCFRGASCFTGYFNEPCRDPTAHTEDGFFRTGDLMKEVRLRGRSYFLFEGRLRDNINRGGEKIGAEEIEKLLSGYPGISDARVTAMPDQIYGEKVCAFVIMRRGCKIPTVADFGQYLLGLGLAKYKLPERIEPVADFPLTSVGKVDKARLRAMIAEKISAEILAGTSLAAQESEPRGAESQQS